MIARMVEHLGQPSKVEKFWVAEKQMSATRQFVIAWD